MNVGILSTNISISYLDYCTWNIVEVFQKIVCVVAEKEEHVTRYLSNESVLELSKFKEYVQTKCTTRKTVGRENPSQRGVTTSKKQTGVSRPGFCGWIPVLLAQMLINVEK